MDTRNASILIIDDDEGVTAALRARLTSHGYECASAASGAQGLAMFRERPVDLVITDLSMPAGDGVQVVHSIRRLLDTPIIVITGYARHYKPALRAVPRVTVLPKPFDSQVIVDLVEAELVDREDGRAHAA